jgi:hypothetical protein
MQTVIMRFFDNKSRHSLRLETAISRTKAMKRISTGLRASWGDDLVGNLYLGFCCWKWFVGSDVGVEASTLGPP